MNESVWPDISVDGSVGDYMQIMSAPLHPLLLSWPDPPSMSELCLILLHMQLASVDSTVAAVVKTFLAACTTLDERSCQGRPSAWNHPLLLWLAPRLMHLELSEVGRRPGMATFLAEATAVQKLVVHIDLDDPDRDMAWLQRHFGALIFEIQWRDADHEPHFHLTQRLQQLHIDVLLLMVETDAAREVQAQEQQQYWVEVEVSGHIQIEYQHEKVVYHLPKCPRIMLRAIEDDRSNSSTFTVYGAAVASVPGLLRVVELHCNGSDLRVINDTGCRLGDRLQRPWRLRVHDVEEIRQVDEDLQAQAREYDYWQDGVLFRNSAAHAAGWGTGPNP